MITTLYNVVTKYRTDTRGAKKDVDRLADSTERLEDKTKRTQGAFSSLGATIKTALAGAATVGVGLLTRHVVGLQSEVENAEIQIASVFSTNKIHSFGKGLERARGLMKRFRKAAITSPGESRDILSIFTSAAPALFRSGNIDDAQLQQFGTRGLATALTLGGGDIKTTGQQLSQILLGQGGADNKIFQALRKPLREALDIDEVGSAFVEQFNRIANTAPRRVFDALMESMASLDAANEAFATTFTGLWGSMKETANEFLLKATRPLFDEMKTSFQDVLGLATDNDEALDELAKTVGEKLAKGFRFLADAVKLAKDNIDGLIVSASVLGTIKVGGALRSSLAGGVLSKAGGVLRQGGAARRKIGGALKGGARAGAGFAGDVLGELLFGSLGSGKGGGLGGRIVRGVKGAPGALKAAGARQIAGKGITFASLGKGATALKGGLGAAASGGFAGLKAILVGAAGAASTLATVLLPLTVIIGMVAGTFRVLKDDTNEATQFLKLSFEELMIALDTLAAQFGFSGEGGFVGMLKSVVDWLGTGVVGVLGLVVKGVELLVSAFSTLVTTIKGLAFGIANIFEGLRAGEITSFDDASAAFSRGFDDAQEQADDALRAAFRRRQKETEESQGTGPTPQEERAMLAEANRKAREKEIADKTKPKLDIKVENKVNVETDADPDRIAFRTAEMTVDSLRRVRRSVRGLPGFE